MDEIQKLKERLAELHDAGIAIQNKADAEKRDMNVDERKRLDELNDEFEMAMEDLTRRERIVAQETKLSKPNPRVVEPDPLPTNVVRQRQPDGLQNTRLRTLEQRQRWDFNNSGEFYKAVMGFNLNPGQADQRLIQNALTTYGSEGVLADGGVAVPPEWSTQIQEAVMAQDSLLPMCDQMPVSGNTMSFPVDETTDWQTTGGILAYWDSEAATMTQSKPALKEITAKLNRLTALVPVTQELLEDAPAMGSYVTRKAGNKMAYKVSDAIVNGTGAGQPLGILNAPCTVQVSKVGSQVAATIHAKNIVAMWARLPSASMRNSVWLVNQDCLPSIYQLGFPVTDGTTSNVGAGALYMGPGQLQGGPPAGMILGRPIVVTEACATVGTTGDIILADMSKYLAIVKSGGVRSDMSIHLYFDQNVVAFRFVMRMNGQPWLSAPITRRSGTNTLTHFVRLEAR